MRYWWTGKQSGKILGWCGRHANSVLDVTGSHPAATGCGKVSGNFQVQDSSAGSRNSSLDGPEFKNKVIWLEGSRKYIYWNEYYEGYLKINLRLARKKMQKVTYTSILSLFLSLIHI